MDKTSDVYKLLEQVAKENGLDLAFCESLYDLGSDFDKSPARYTPEGHAAFLQSLSEALENAVNIDT